MKLIVFDIGHPAHVHYFKHTIKKLISKNYNVKVFARDKEVTFSLLNDEKIVFESRGKGEVKLINKVFYLIKTVLRMLVFGIINRPKVWIGFGSPYIALAGFFSFGKVIILDDTENARYGQMIYRPFSDLILSPKSFKKNFGKKHFKFNSFMELFYLHPEIFKKKDMKVKKFILFRFVGWGAVHDIGHQGVSTSKKKEIINRFKDKCNIYISSEKELDNELKSFQLKIKPSEMHNYLSNAFMLFGESATMASEAAMLGIPSIYIDNEGRGYTDDLESKYKLVYNFKEDDKSINNAILKTEEIIKSDILKYKEASKKLLKNNINPNDYLLNIINKMS